MTLVVLVVTGAMAAAQAADPALLGHLERTPAALHGEPWRIGTALLVQDGGVIGALSNLAFLAAVGIVAEQVLSRSVWLAQYLGIGVAAELVGHAWQPVGGGNSIAVCGLAGAVAVALWRGDPRLPALSAPVVLVWCGALAGTASAELAPPAVLVSAAAAGLALRRRARGHDPGRPVAAVVAATGIALAAATSIHGAALLGGIALALSLHRSLRRPGDTAGVAGGNDRRGRRPDAGRDSTPRPGRSPRCPAAASAPAPASPPRSAPSPPSSRPGWPRPRRTSPSGRSPAPRS
jgi:membrane associated rhomboid family serine protease